jgi:hypothetical protein
MRNILKLLLLLPLSIYSQDKSVLMSFNFFDGYNIENYKSFGLDKTRSFNFEVENPINKYFSYTVKPGFLVLPINNNYYNSIKSFFNVPNNQSIDTSFGIQTCFYFVTGPKLNIIENNYISIGIKGQIGFLLDFLPLYFDTRFKEIDSNLDSISDIDLRLSNGLAFVSNLGIDFVFKVSNSINLKISTNYFYSSTGLQFSNSHYVYDKIKVTIYNMGQIFINRLVI